MGIRTRVLIGSAILLLSVCFPTERVNMDEDAPLHTARKRIPVLIGTTEVLDRIGDLPPEALGQLRSGEGEYAMGFYYEAFQIFWMNVWTWDGHYVIYQSEQEYVDTTPEEMEMLLGFPPEEEFSPPMGYRFPLGMILLLLVGVYFVVRFIRRLRANTA